MIYKELFSKMINLQTTKKELINALKKNNLSPSKFNAYVMQQVRPKQRQKKTLRVADLLDNEFLSSIVATPHIKAHINAVEHRLCTEAGKLYTYSEAKEVVDAYCRKYNVKAGRGFARCFYRSLKFFIYKKYKK